MGRAYSASRITSGRELVPCQAKFASMPRPEPGVGGHLHCDLAGLWSVASDRRCSAAPIAEPGPTPGAAEVVLDSSGRSPAQGRRQREATSSAPAVRNTR